MLFWVIMLPSKGSLAQTHIHHFHPPPPKKKNLPSPTAKGRKQQNSLWTVVGQALLYVLKNNTTSCTCYYIIPVKQTFSFNQQGQTYSRNLSGIFPSILPDHFLNCLCMLALNGIWHRYLALTSTGFSHELCMSPEIVTKCNGDWLFASYNLDWS